MCGGGEHRRGGLSVLGEMRGKCKGRSGRSGEGGLKVADGQISIVWGKRLTGGEEQA